MWFLPIEGSSSVNEDIWDGEKGSADKIHVLCYLAELLTRFQNIKFTKSILIWTVTGPYSYMLLVNLNV